MLNYIKYLARTIGLKALFIRLQNLVLKWRGYGLLNVDETNAFMAPSQVIAIPGNTVDLPQVLNGTDVKKIIFAAKPAATDPVFVWDYHAPEGKTGRISKYGSVVVNRKVLCTDWNQGSFYKDIWKADERPVKTAHAVIALFSQFQDGIFYGGYYDFIFLVATKLSRIREALADVDFSNILVSYPLFNASYEREYLQLLGINTANLVDSSKYQIECPRVLTGNSAHWYPNIADVLCLKQWVEKKYKPVKTASNRIYISRSGRRRVVNEGELITMLKKFNFVIIEDKPRSVTEQISLYYNASFILGPHGASFSNIIWCAPGAHLFELFSPNYAPDFFLYLANIMQLNYSAFYDGGADSQVDYLDGLVEDIEIPIPKLQACLESIFKTDQL